MNKLAKKYLRPSQIPTKACHGCGIGMNEIIGGGLGGPLRDLPPNRIAPAKPALEGGRQ
jgi:hypothetical protein